MCVFQTKYPGLLETGFCIPGMKLYYTDRDEVEIKLAPEVTHHFTNKDVEEREYDYKSVSLIINVFNI